jgi:CRP/FNR family transcriptional regulator, cyclic AMP receptor protein
MDEMELLARSELFSAFDRGVLQQMVLDSRRVECDRNDVMFEEGDEADEMFVVQTGRVAIGRRSPDGRESLVALMEPGDLFGEMSLFDDGSRSASARALERSSLLGLPYAGVRKALDDEPELLWDVVSLLAQRLRTTDDALADAVLLDVTGRTAKRMLELAGDQSEFQLPITQEELAGLVGASRERVNKSIAAFVRLGWIEQSDRRYRIVERDRLEQRAR